jgi:adenylate cyclase
MAEERVKRKLAAILAADVVGCSRLMGADEAGTLSALKRHREAIFDPAVAAHSGRIVKLIGDGVIAEFGSVVDAVNCALSVQCSDANRPDQSTSQPTIVLRIGINLGDVIIEGGDIYAPSCHSPICQATLNRSTSPTASAKISLLICRKSPA